MKKRIILPFLISMALTFSAGAMYVHAEGVSGDNALDRTKTEDKKTDHLTDFLKNTANSKYAVALQAMNLEEIRDLYKKGVRAFEIRVSATSDNNLVLADNFNQYYQIYYGKSLPERPTIDQYVENNMLNGTKMTMGDLNRFIDTHPDCMFFVRSFDERDCFDILDKMPLKHKDKFIPVVKKTVTNFKNLNKIAVLDQNNAEQLKNMIFFNKDKNYIFMYQNVEPSLDVRQLIKEKNIVSYRYNNNVKDDLYYGNIHSALEIGGIIFEPAMYKVPQIYKRPQIKNDKFIAHAGGKYEGIRLSNTLQAMNNSYNKGCRMIEIDFDYTVDGKAVQVHDWGNFNRMCENQAIRSFYMKYDEFKSYKLIHNLTQMSIDDTIKWLQEHKDAYIVTDIKEENMKNSNYVTLKYVAEKAPEIVDRIIPQIYSIDQYQTIKDIGYNNIIFTLYRSFISPYEVLEFTKCNDVFAVTMDKDVRIKTSLPAILQASNQRVYTHTVNDANEAKSILYGYKAYGIYSDEILSENELNNPTIF